MDRVHGHIAKLLAACIRTLIAVLVGTGMQLDEALHLQWLNVDLDQRRIRVRRGRCGPTKSGKFRSVPLFDSVLPVPREMKIGAGANIFRLSRILGHASVVTTERCTRTSRRACMPQTTGASHS